MVSIKRTCRVVDGPADGDLRVAWRHGAYEATLSATLRTRDVSIGYRDPDSGEQREWPDV